MKQNKMKKMARILNGISDCLHRQGQVGYIVKVEDDVATIKFRDGVVGKYETDTFEIIKEVVK